MIVYAVSQALILLVIGIFVVTQIVTPLLKGTALFPMFGRRARIEDDMIRIREEREIIELEKKREQEQKDLDRLKNLHVVKKEEGN